MKSGYKHKTGYFGTGGEWYASSLFNMHRVDNGHSRPDLLGLSPEYSNPLAIEVKSNGQNKADVNIGSLFYAVLPIDAKGETYQFSDDAEFKDYIFNPRKNGVPVYFDFLRRTDGLSSADLKHPFSAIEFTYGDHFISPADYIFHMFCVAHSLRERESPKESVRRVRENLIGTFLNGWHDTQRSSRDFQSLNPNDIKYLATQNKNYLKRGNGAKRLELIKEIYPEIEGLKSKIVDGPNASRIWILYDERNSCEISDLEKNISERKEIIERVSNERVRAIPLSRKKTKYRWQPGFEQILECGTEANGEMLDLREIYTPKTLERMQRLNNWLAPGEKPKRTMVFETSADITPQENIGEGDLFYKNPEDSGVPF